MQALSRYEEPKRKVVLPPQEMGTLFRTLSADTARPRRGARLFLVTSVAVHVGVLGALSLHHHTSRRTDLQVRVAVVEPSALHSGPPKARPAAQPTVKSLPAKISTRRRDVAPLVAPKEVVPLTQVQPAGPAEPDTNTVEENIEGSSGGAGSGSVGGPIGGQAPAIAPAPPPPPARPTMPIFENEANMRRRRIAGHDPGYPAKAERNGIEGVVIAKVIIGPDGRVNDVILLQTHPGFEAVVRDAIASWKFAPLVVDGTAKAVYTVFRFTFKLS